MVAMWKGMAVSSDNALEHAALRAALARGLADAEAGRVGDLAAAIAKLLRELGLPVKTRKGSGLGCRPRHDRS